MDVLAGYDDVCHSFSLVRIASTHSIHRISYGRALISLDNGVSAGVHLPLDDRKAFATRAATALLILVALLGNLE